jgi:high-affinity iron transporter
MIESFIILLREGIEVSLVIGILIVYLRKVRRGRFLPAVYFGLGLAIAASIGGAFLFSRLSLDNESLEGYLLLIAAVFVTTMIVWMWRTGRRLRGEIERRVDDIVSDTSSWKNQLGIIAFTFLMVFREGIETALFLGAVSLSQGNTQSFVGGMSGLTLAVAFGILFVKGSVRIDLGKFLKVTAVVLLIFVGQLVVNAIHEFLEMGILPPQPAVMGIVGPIVRNNVLFILAIVSIPAFMFMIPGTQRRDNSPAVSLATRRWQFGAGLITLLIVFFLGFDELYSSHGSATIEPPLPVELNDGHVHLPLHDVDDGRLHRYSLKQDSISIRFFVLRTGLNTFATAFDACRPCYNYGKYYVSGSDVVCSQCEATYPTSKLSHPKISDEASSEAISSSDNSEELGCRPIYLRSKIENGQILISAEDLLKKREYFEIRRDGE